MLYITKDQLKSISTCGSEMMAPVPENVRKEDRVTVGL